jgi:Zn-dependent protease with chaperone function
VAGWYRGLSATLLHALLVPLGHALRPVFLHGILGLRRDSMTYVLGEFVWTSAQLAVTFPLQTAQRRLQAQWTPVVRRGRRHDRPFTPAVRLSPIRYTGVLDCLQRVAQEESVGALYRGFVYQWTGTVLLSLLGSLARLDDDVEVEVAGAGTGLRPE